MISAAIIALLITLALTLIRAFRGPCIYDRILAVNSFGTKSVLLIVVAGDALGWFSYVDIALMYALINFIGTLAVMRFFEQYNPQEEQS
ncbi:MAG: monovalent cation/H+ antiporter complex subunit F [Campylobacterota bacterium]|nr:monovalent cation/H+ antiporter complex subunit F [Campylobacterota bacterium]